MRAVIVSAAAILISATLAGAAEPIALRDMGSIDRAGPSIILFHSQAGSFGFKVAEARPDKVKALIAIEPAGLGDPATVDVLKNIPTLIVYGDDIERDSRWPEIR